MPENEQPENEPQEQQPRYAPPTAGASVPPPYQPGDAPAPHGQQAPYGQQAPVGQQPPQQPPYGQQPPQQPPYGQQPGYGQQPPQDPNAPYAQPAYGQAPYAQMPYGYVMPSGRRFWAMGFLTYIPYVGFIVFLIVALAMNASARRDANAVVRENARWAANWSLSVATFIVGAIILMIIGGATGASLQSSGSNPSIAFVFVAIGGLVILATGIMHLVFTIMGTVQADRRVFKPALVIPYLRERS